MGTISDIYGVDDDDGGQQPQQARVNRTPTTTDLLIDGQSVSLPSIEHVQLLEKRLLMAEQTILRLVEELSRVKQSGRRRQSDIDAMRRRIDSSRIGG